MPESGDIDHYHVLYGNHVVEEQLKFIAVASALLLCLGGLFKTIL